MNILVFGRGKDLLNTANKLAQEGHKLLAIVTAESESYHGTSPKDYQSLALQVGCPFVLVTRRKQVSFFDLLSEMRPELAISVNWPFILDEEDLQRIGCRVLNAHAGDLPRYQGNACPSWAILNLEKRIGLSIHEMIPNRVDAGPVFAKSFLEISEETYIGEIYEWMSKEIPELFQTVITEISHGKSKPQDQATINLKPLRCFPRRDSDAYIDWRNTTAQILTLIRASSRPLPGAYSYAEGLHKVSVHKARKLEMEQEIMAIPGQVLFLEGTSPVVATSDGAIVLLEYESSIEGMKTLSRMRTRLQMFSYPGVNPH